MPEAIKKWKQFVVSIAANLGSGSAGLCGGWSSPSIVRLTEKDSPLNESLDADKVGWIISLLSLGAVFGPFFVWQLVDRIGRKWCLLTSAVTYLIACILLLAFEELWALYVARFFQGLTVGIVMGTEPIYNGEIATDDCRGAVGTIMPLMMLCGSLIVTTVGPIVTYSQIQWICLPIAIIFPVIFIFMPDTPHYYISKRDVHKAIMSLKFLRGQAEKDVIEEYEKIKKCVEEALENKKTSFDLFRNKSNLKAFGICAGLIIFQQITGVTSIMFNMQSIFSSSKTINPVTFFIILGVLQLITVFISMYVIERCGRKILLLISATFMSLSLIGLGVFFRIQKTSGNVNSFQWLPTTSLVTFMMAYALGFSIVPWVIVSEIFPSNVKGLAGAIIVCICYLLSFVVTKIYPFLVEFFGLDVIMWLYGIFAGLSCIFIHFAVFETKGMNLQEIQHKLSS